MTYDELFGRQKPKPPKKRIAERTIRGFIRRIHEMLQNPELTLKQRMNLLNQAMKLRSDLENIPAKSKADA